MMKSNLSPADQALVDEALKEIDAAIAKRRKEFLDALGLTEADWQAGAKAHENYAAKMGPRRPFSRAPISQESFIAGFWAEKWGG